MAGLVAFAVWGLMPSLVWGGFAGITMAHAILGHPIDGGILAKTMIVLGMLVMFVLWLLVFVGSGAGLGAMANKLVARFGGARR